MSLEASSLVLKYYCKILDCFSDQMLCIGQHNLKKMMPNSYTINGHLDFQIVEPLIPQRDRQDFEEYPESKCQYACSNIA